ncbi:YbaB/EbfC family nucleoid-associated protein [Glycomyces sp. TRM65418]|uniref:YbaB/EbfC family nucleoid-associated protein n=1 Tax=Glycomyces sp. TRM65418 TaxID=2867006 RepID=UPI001CE69AEF|nr:YbaB/EbfC family nucleoid-associated protein [Glycomyces sp. TRM65418]MCC3765605.1 YbaB/EbfC family nucleoid-associated protein [Glycomyces sp. TRM65418]QZD55206.1 YbaB/EbfC family nucleoid-associated protein [Glycomyces sp. TRM65418]
MSSPADQSGIIGALEQALQVAKDGQRAQEEAGNSTVEVEAAKGMVRVEATLAGKVTVTIDNPRAMRLGSAELAEEITIGVNAALDKAREQAGLPGAVDLDALNEKVEEIQQQSVQQLSSFMSTLADSHARIVRAAAESKGVN